MHIKHGPPTAGVMSLFNHSDTAGLAIDDPIEADDMAGATIR